MKRDFIHRFDDHQMAEIYHRLQSPFAIIVSAENIVDAWNCIQRNVDGDLQRVPSALSKNHLYVFMKTSAAASEIREVLEYIE